MEPVPNFDLYAELEVSRTATTPTIDAAWRSLLKRNHPDLGGPRAAERTVRLNIAHDWLTDPDLRARYDETRKQARRERAEATAAAASAAAAAAARDRARPPSGARTAEPPPVPTSSRPAVSRPAWMEAPALRHVVERVRRGSAARAGRDRWRVLLPVIAALLIVGGLGMLLVVPGPGAGSPAAVASPTGSAPTSQAAVPLARTPTPGSSAGVTPGASPTASARRPSPSPSAPAISLSGGGDHPPTRVAIAGGTYRVDYVVSSPAGESCPWAIYLTDAAGLDLLMATAYPVDETVRDTARDAGIAAGPAAVRVESGCPRWSVSITRAGP